jgi:hypothetical protein
MKQDYLWDGSGEPDPEVQKLESALGKLRHTRPAPVFPEIAQTRPQAGRWRLFPRPGWLRWAAATAIPLAAALGFILLRPKPALVSPTSVSPAGWDVTRVEGIPRVGAEAMRTANGTGKLGVGQLLETDSLSKARIRAEETGEIDVEPDTRLRLLSNGAGTKRLALDRGTIHASIWAPPGEFVVDTPSAIAVDLGCVYTLHVDDSGDGLLRTTLGWVGFKLDGRESFIPAGAAGVTRKKTGLGTPYFEDASQPFRAALAGFDLATSTSAERAVALRFLLSHSRKRDALTLWHLLSRVEDSERGRVYDRLAELVPAPAGVTREGIQRLDRKILDLWWNELGLGDISVWRHWERAWPQADPVKQ